MRSGWVGGGGVTDEKGGSRKRGGSGPLTPHLDTPMILVYLMFKFIQWSCQLFAISREDIQEDTIIITTKNSEHLLLEEHSLVFSSLTESMAMSLITG